MESEQAFLARLRVGPAVLLLGQNYLALESGRNPVLELIDTKYGLGVGAGQHGILTGGLPSQGDPAVRWLDVQSSKLPQPPWLGVVASFPWSALYTSAVDSAWIEAFRNDWRELRPVYDELQRPDQPRNKVELMSTLLFGSARWHEFAPMPSSAMALRVRRPAATNLLRRIPELVTPRGVLAIEGYSPDDWVTPDDLLSSLDGLAINQAHMFSVTEEIARLEVIEYLVDLKKLVLHGQSLASTIQSGFEQGIIKAGSPVTGLETGHRIELADGVLDVPRELWRRISRSGHLLEDDVLTEPKALSKAAKYAAFRRFLETSEGKPDWQGHARGFAFERDFEATLRTVVAAGLAAKQLQERPVILHGATGTGKTMALARLAYRVRVERTHPVLYIPHRVRPPALDDVEAFVGWAESAGAPAVLIIWDGMLSHEEYSNLTRLLTSRGRKAVVVGSSYRQDAAAEPAIEVPRSLTQGEISRFVPYLRSVDPDMADASPASSFMKGAEFLVSLYRLLPPSRLQLRRGVAREVGFAETLMAERERTSTITVTPRTAMEWALFEGGILEDLPPLLIQDAELAGETVQNVQRLTGLVMVPGQFGLAVPLELLLRALGRGSYENFAELLRGTDVFEWFEDDAGNIEIGPRTALEAQIVAQSRLGGPATEVQVSCELIREMSLDSVSAGGNREAQFVARLAQAFDSERAGPSYKPYFNEIANALEALRIERSVRVPELMLQEAHLRREWSRAVELTVDPAERLAALGAAQDVLQLALEAEDDLSRRHNYMRMSLMTELASIMATMARLQITAFKDRASAFAAYETARSAVQEARRLAPDNYYSLDVLAWATIDLVRAGLLDADTQVEALAELITAFETADITKGDKSAESLLKRQMEIGQLFGETKVEDEAFAALLHRGSASGIILRALQLAGGPRQDEWTKEGAAKAFAFADEQSRPLESVDQRLMETMFNLGWVAAAGERAFARERVALPFGPAEWQQVVRLTQRALANGESSRPTKLLFLRGLAEFHLNSHALALETFREVERDSFAIRSRWNVIRSYVASNEYGVPRVFHGIVADVFEGGLRGEVYVEELQQRIPFRARDFGGQPFVRGDPLQALHIAFSLQGPIADPVSAYGVARDRETQAAHRAGSRSGPSSTTRTPARPKLTPGPGPGSGSGSGPTPRPGPVPKPPPRPGSSRD